MVHRVGTADMIQREISGGFEHKRLRIAYRLALGCLKNSQVGLLHDVLDVDRFHNPRNRSSERGPVALESTAELPHAVLCVELIRISHVASLHLCASNLPTRPVYSHCPSTLICIYRDNQLSSAELTYIVV